MCGVSVAAKIPPYTLAKLNLRHNRLSWRSCSLQEDLSLSLGAGDTVHCGQEEDVAAIV
jgi:hypothetical protein